MTVFRRACRSPKKSVFVCVGLRLIKTGSKILKIHNSIEPFE
jgi:hypothetical protein